MSGNPRTDDASNPTLRDVTAQKGCTAVIAVHGVADQQRGQTAEAIAALLASAGTGIIQREDCMLRVPHMEPAQPHPRHWAQDGWLQFAKKSLGQSWGTDFLRAPKSASRAPHGTLSSAELAGTEAGQLDLGATYTDYLIAKAHRWREQASERAEKAHTAPPQGFDTTSVAVVRVRAEEFESDVFEMYWADLSRVSGRILSLVSELMTLLFRFSHLSTEALAIGAKEERSWHIRLLAQMQRMADWIFSRLLGPAAVQLLIGFLLLIPAKVAYEHLMAALTAVTVLVGIGTASAWVYRRHVSWLLALAVSFTLAALALFYGTYLAVMFTWLALLTVLYLRALRTWEEKFRAVYLTNLLMYAGALVALASGLAAPGYGNVCERWAVGATRVIEGALCVNALLWPIEGFLILATVILYEIALHGCEGRCCQILVTGRLGMFSSVGSFLVLFMVGLQLGGRAVPEDVGQISYQPWHFRMTGSTSTVASFLTERARSSSAGFALIALVLLGLIGFSIVVFLPSVLHEIRLMEARSSRRLGMWLTRGYQGIEGLVRAWGLPTGLAALAISTLLASHELKRWGVVSSSLEAQTWISKLISRPEADFGYLSATWLSGIMYAMAGSTVGVLVLGKVFLRAKELRAPVDAAFDVDNHFREFPRKCIARVRILERYLAILQHLRGQGYERIVIVAHSQGTVITADLLRYLQQRSALRVTERSECQSRVCELAGWLRARNIQLLTVGCPLRQLYALRFPDMYRWVLSPVEPACEGPIPEELGLARWINLWSSGDYVGRWLWSPVGVSVPRALAVGERQYETEWESPDSTCKDGCIGAGAHTHYFDLEQTRVASELRTLVTEVAVPPRASPTATPQHSTSPAESLAAERSPRPPALSERPHA